MAEIKCSSLGKVVPLMLSSTGHTYTCASGVQMLKTNKLILKSNLLLVDLTPVPEALTSSSQALHNAGALTHRQCNHTCEITIISKIFLKTNMLKTLDVTFYVELHKRLDMRENNKKE